MDSVDYILRIILRLRDEASAKLAAIRTQIRGISTDTDATKAKLDGLNSSISSMTRRLGNLRSRITDVVNDLKDISDDEEGLQRINLTLGALGKNLEKLGTNRTASRQATQQNTEALNKEAVAMTNVKERAEELVAQGVNVDTALKQASLERRRDLDNWAAQVRAEVHAEQELGKHIADAAPASSASTAVSKAPSARSKQTDEIAQRFDFLQLQNKAGNFVRVLDKSTNEVLIETGGMRAARKAVRETLKAEAEAIKSVTGELDKQGEAAKADAEDSKKEPVTAAIEKSVDNLRFEIQQVGKKWGILDNETGKIISKHVRMELAVDKLQQAGLLAAKNQEEQAAAIEEKTRAIQKDVTPTATPQEDTTTASDEADRAAAARTRQESEKEARATAAKTETIKKEVVEAEGRIRDIRNDKSIRDQLSAKQLEYLDAITGIVTQVKITVNEFKQKIATIQSQAAEDENLITVRQISQRSGQLLPGTSESTFRRTAGGAPAGQGGNEAEKQLTAQDKKVKDLTDRYNRLVESISLVRREFISGEIDEKKFLFQTNSIRLAIERLARSAPVDFGEKIGLKFFQTGQELRAEVENFRKIGEESKNLESVVAAFEKIKRGVSNVNREIDLTRGAMQILNKEGDDFRGLGLEGLTAHLTETQQQVSALQIDLSARQRAGGATTTVERTIQRLQSRVAAQKEALRQLVVEAVSARTVVGDIDEELDLSPLEKLAGLEEKFARITDELRSGKIARTTAVLDFRDLSAEINKLAKQEPVGSDARRIMNDLVEQAKDMARFEAEALGPTREQQIKQARDLREEVQAFSRTRAELHSTLTRIQEEFDKNPKVFGAEQFAKDLENVAKGFDKLAVKKDIATETRREIEEAARFARDLSAATKAATDQQELEFQTTQKNRESKAKDAFTRMAEASRALTLAQNELFHGEFQDEGEADKAKGPLGRLFAIIDARKKDANVSQQQSREQKKRDDEANKGFRTYMEGFEKARQASSDFFESIEEGALKTARDNDTLAQSALNFRARFQQAQERFAGGFRSRELVAEFRDVQQGLNKVSLGYKDDRDRANEFGAAAIRAGEFAAETLAKVRSDGDGTANVFQRLSARIGQAGNNITKYGENVAQFDNQLRGLAVLAIFIFAQQLLTGLQGLAGGLVAVGSSAAYAGAALGVSFVSGIAEALPMVGLLVAAMGQVKSVFDAVQQADLVRQQGFQRSIKGDEQAATKANQLANAQDAVAAANDRVSDANKRLTEAQENLNKAREEASANLRDLVLQEREAALAARGAALSEKEAQERLSSALLGGSNLDLQQAELGVAESRLGTQQAVRRRTQATQELRQGRDIENVDAVVAAKKQVEQAHEAIDDAVRGVDRAKRSMDNAGISATKLQDETFSAQSKLIDMLAMLSPAQQRLFVAFENIRAQYQKTFVPITDIIIDSFSRGVDSATEVLKNPRFLLIAKTLAGEMAGAFDAIREHTLLPENFAKELTIIDQGRDKIKPIVDIITDLEDAFLNLAIAGDPAFTTILGWFTDLADDIRRVTARKDDLAEFFDLGAENAVSWLDLVKNTVIFFAVLAGAGGANEGLDLVNDLNDAILNATQYIKDNRVEVEQFFSDAGDVVRIIAGVLFEAVKAVNAVFAPKTLENFADLLNNTVLPALVLATTGISTLVSALLEVLDLPVVGDLAKWGLAFFLIINAMLGLFAALTLAGLRFGHFLDIVGGSIGKFGAANGVIGKFVGWLAEMAGKTVLLAPLASMLGRIATAMKAKTGEKTLVDALDVADDIAPDGTRKRKSGIIIPGAAKGIEAEGKKAGEAAEDVGKKAGGRFSTGFLGTASKFLRGALWLQLGIGAVEGVLTGIKTGNVESGIRDFVHSISFGLVDSAEEVAKDAADRAAKVLEDATKKSRGANRGTLPRNFFLPPEDFRLGNQTVNGVSPGMAIRGAIPGSQFSQSIIAQARARVTSDPAAQRFAEDLEKISKVKPDVDDLTRKFGELGNKFADFRSKKDIVHMEQIGREMDGVRGKIVEQTKDRWPGFANAIDKFQQDANKSIDRFNRKLDEAFKPQVIANKFSFDLLTNKDKDGHVKNFRDLIDKSLAEMSRLKPGAQKRSKAAIDAMVDQLVKQGDLPAKEGAKIRQRLDKEWDKLKESTDRKTARAARLASINMMAMTAVIQAQIGLMTENVNGILKAFGVGPVSIPKIGKNSVKDFGSIIGTAGQLLGGISSGGVVGFSEGGMPGMYGERGKDTIPAWIGRGEMVFNKFHQRYLQPAVQAYYGHGLSDTFKRIKGEHAGPSVFTRGGGTGFAAGRDTGVDIFDGHPSNINNNLLKLLKLLKDRFPGSTVESTTDHSTLTTNGKRSDHVDGNAFDIGGPTGLMNRMASFILSSGIWKRLAQGIHQGSPNLSINQGKQVPTSYWGPDTWAQHINHLHLAMTGALGRFRDVADGISTRLKKTQFGFPVEGAVKDLGQAALDKVTAAANRRLRRAQRESGDGDAEDSVSIRGSGTRAAKIFKYFKDRGFTDNQAAAWIGNFSQETGGTFDPGIIQPNGEGHGIAQWGGGRFAALQTFAKERGTAWQNLQTQLDFVWHELRGSESGAYRGITGSRSLADAVAAIARLYERAGIIGDRLTPARVALDRYGGEFAKGGEVPGGKGLPVGITAHGGEWVVNESQQSRLAGMIGTTVSTLKSMLGFYGGKGSFAGGGDPAKQVDSIFTTENERDRIRRLVEGVFKLPALPVRALADLFQEADNAIKSLVLLGSSYARRIAAINREIRDLRRGGVTDDEKSDLAALQAEKRRITKLPVGKADPKTAPRFINTISELTKEDGLLDQLDKARERMTTQFANQLGKLSLRIEKVGKGFRVVKIDSAAKAADLAISNAKKELDAITGEKGVVDSALGAVTSRLKKLRQGGVSKKEAPQVAALVQQQNNLRDEQLDLESQRQEAINAIYEAQVARVQADVDAINNKFAQSNTELDITSRLATVFGNKGALNNVTDQRIAGMKQQISLLEPQIKIAERMGNAEMAQTIRNQIADLNASIAEAARKKIEDAVASIQEAASKREAALGLAERIASLFGNKTGIQAVLNGRIASIQTEIQDLSAQAAAAGAAGNVDLQEQIQEQIAELSTSITEITVQGLQNAIDAVNNTAQRRLGRLDLFERMAAALGVVGLEGTAAVGGEALSRSQVFQQRNTALETQRAGLQEQLSQVQLLTPENTAMIEDLTEQLAELGVTIAENTKAAFQARVEDVNSRTSFSLNIVSLQQRIAELTGQITNTDTADQVRSFLEQRSGILEQQQAALTRLLHEAQQSGDQQAINDLTTQLLENQVAILENTQAINQLTGASNLQDFSSSAWRQFRQAIFDGLGNLLPRYAVGVPSAAMGAYVSGGGMVRVHAGEEIIPASVIRKPAYGGNTQEINTDVYLTNPTEVADPVYLGEAIGWRIANNPNLRP